MQMGNTLFTLGGLILISIFTLSLNTSIVDNQAVLYQSEEVLEAIALAQRYIEEAEALRFDEIANATIPTSFTHASNLGADAGEYYSNYDDLDDFNGFSTTLTSGTIHYTVNISVGYVLDSNLDLPISTRTYNKKMVVTVTSPVLKVLPTQAIVLKRLFAYHYFFSE